MNHNKQFEQFNNPQHFEVHVTIFPTNDVEPFIKLCNSFVDHAAKFKEYKGTNLESSNVISCKPIIIVLPEGKYAQQPMCSTYVYGSLVQAVKYGEIFSDYVVESHSDYKVSRNKVEARLRNVDDNISLDPSKEEFEGKYWEFHAKLSFNAKDILNKLKLNTVRVKSDTEILENHIQAFREELMKSFPSCRLSKSALSNYDKINTDNCTRIVTLRIYSGNKLNATNSLNTLINFLNSVGSNYNFEMRGDVEKELSVYDSNVKHDIGWISMIDVNANINISQHKEKKSLAGKACLIRYLLFSAIGVLIVFTLMYIFVRND